MVLLLSILTIGKCSIGTNYNIRPKVDERVELLSIVFRLADASEYKMCSLKAYSQKIDSSFLKYKNHQTILFVKKIRKENSIYFERVMSIALHLKIENGIISLNEKLLKTDINKRLGKYLNEFVRSLNVFYKESAFNEFFISNEEYYKQTENNFQIALDKIDFPWFERYYGEMPNINFNVVLCLNNGRANYGPKISFPDGRSEVYSILGAWDTDAKGIPSFDNTYTRLIIHEFSHSFCNTLIEDNYVLMKDRADQFYKSVKDKMGRQSYRSSKKMLYETLVRASVIKYLQSHIDNKDISENLIEYELSKEKANGFLGIKGLVDLLSSYEQGNYKTLREFMPKVVELQNSLLAVDMLAEIAKNSPQITSSTIQNDDMNVDPSTTKLILTFDKPMNTWNTEYTFRKNGNKTLPKLREAEWNCETKYQITFIVELEPNREYSVKFPASRFFDQEFGNPLIETFRLNFKTSSAINLKTKP